MERTDEFRRRAFSAAGPVFLVSLGLVLLVTWAILGLLPGTPPVVAWVLGMAGLLAMAGGILWAAVQNRRSRASSGRAS